MPSKYGFESKEEREQAAKRAEEERLERERQLELYFKQTDRVVRDLLTDYASASGAPVQEISVHHDTIRREYRWTLIAVGLAPVHIRLRYDHEKGISFHCDVEARTVAGALHKATGMPVSWVEMFYESYIPDKTVWLK